MKNEISLFSGLLFLGIISAQAATPPASDYEKLPAAKKGGTLAFNILGNPGEISWVIGNSAEVSKKILPLIFMSLYDEDMYKLGPVRALAISHEISKDRKIYTFKLDPKAKWQDGTPVTAEDVKFTLDLILNPKVDAAVRRAYYSGTTATVIDAQTIRFKVEKPTFDTFMQLYGIYPLQKKQFEKESDFNKSPGIMNPIGNGPYILKSFSRDQKLEFARNPNWWGKDLPVYKNQFNFDTILLKIAHDTNLTYERFVSGDLDIVAMNAEVFTKKARGSDADRIGKKPGDGKSIWASEIPNKAPKSTYDLAWNLESPLFKSVKTRRALSHLVNRDGIDEKIFYGQRVKTFSFMGTGSIDASPAIMKDGTRIDYDAKKGAQLLAEDGWKDTDGDNILDKVIDGKKTPFRFSVKYPTTSSPRSKIAQILKEDFKKTGIEITIQGQDAPVFSEDMDKHHFDAGLIGWVPALVKNPKQVWHSTSAEGGGSNYCSYKNPEVDKLIDEANTETDTKKRAKILQKIDLILYRDQPYTLLNEEKAMIYGFSKRIKSPHWLLPYSQEAAVSIYSTN